MESLSHAALLISFLAFADVAFGQESQQLSYLLSGRRGFGDESGLEVGPSADTSSKVETRLVLPVTSVFHTAQLALLLCQADLKENMEAEWRTLKTLRPGGAWREMEVTRTKAVVLVPSNHGVAVNEGWISGWRLGKGSDFGSADSYDGPFKPLDTRGHWWRRQPHFAENHETKHRRDELNVPSSVSNAADGSSNIVNVPLSQKI
ncbi:hypothetical protein MRX96_019705 [Rhipicephalus microplus]